MRVADRHGQRELVHPGGQRGLGAFEIGHQRHHGQAGVGERVLHHLHGVGHLRHEVGGHERAHLNFAQATGHQRVNPAQFVGGGHGGFDRLQAVTRAHFADQNVKGGKAGHDEIRQQSICAKKSWVNGY